MFVSDMQFSWAPPAAEYINVEISTGKVAEPEPVTPLEDNSAELIAWLNSPEGTLWSRTANKAVQNRFHAIIEDHDDHKVNCPCQDEPIPGTTDSRVYWDNSKFDMRHYDGAEVKHEILDGPVPFDPDYVF